MMSKVLIKNNNIIILHQTKFENIKVELEELEDNVFIIKTKIVDDSDSSTKAKLLINNFKNITNSKLSDSSSESSDGLPVYTGPKQFGPIKRDNHSALDIPDFSTWCPKEPHDADHNINEMLNKWDTITIDNDGRVNTPRSDNNEDYNKLPSMEFTNKLNIPVKASKPLIRHNNLINDHCISLTKLTKKLNGKDIPMYEDNSIRKIKERLNRLFRIVFGITAKKPFNAELITLDILNNKEVVEQIIAILKNELKLEDKVLVGPNTDKLLFKDEETFNKDSNLIVACRKGMALSFMQFIVDKITDEELLIKLNQMSKFVQEEDAFSRLHKKEDDKFDDITFDLLNDKLETRLKIVKYNTKYTTTDIEVLLLSFYTYLFPFRQMELCELKWDSDSEDCNSIDTVNNLCHIRVHKNDKKQGLIFERSAYNIPKELMDILKEYKNGKLKDCEWVIPNISKNQMHPDYVTKTFNKIFDGRKVSSQVLRRKLSTEHYKKFGNDFKAILEYSQGCGHSISTTFTDYIKN
jgi:integrase